MSTGISPQHISCACTRACQSIQRSFCRFGTAPWAVDFFSCIPPQHIAPPMSSLERNAAAHDMRLMHAPITVTIAFPLVYLLSLPHRQEGLDGASGPYQLPARLSNADAWDLCTKVCKSAASMTQRHSCVGLGTKVNKRAAGMTRTDCGVDSCNNVCLHTSISSHTKGIPIQDVCTKEETPQRVVDETCAHIPIHLRTAHHLSAQVSYSC